MGEVEMSVNEEGVLRVVHRYDLRVLLRRLRAEGFARHLVVTWPNCSCLSKSVQDRKFNRVLMIFFLITITLAVINLIVLEQLLTHNRPPNELSTWDHIFNRTWLFGHFQIGQRGIVLLAMFVAVLAVGVLAKTATRKTGSAAARGEEVQTISDLVQQV